MHKIGYFYLIKDYVIGEAIDSAHQTFHEGHAVFWEVESPKLFNRSPEIQEIKLCWYGCDRGRITLFENQYQLFGTSKILKNRMRILELYGFDNNSPQVVDRRDGHYLVDAMDKEIIVRNLNYFGVPIKYPYLLGNL